MEKFDVVVAGAGNAALAAALAAHEQGKSVCVLEKSPKALRGGNTYFTGGGFGFIYKGIEQIKELVPELTKDEVALIDVPGYSADEFFNNVMRVTEGLSDPELLEILVRESYATVRWLQKQGVKFEMNVDRAVRIGNRTRWAKGGSAPARPKGSGAGLSDMLFDIVVQKGIDLRYETKAVKLVVDSRGRVSGITAQTKDGFQDIAAKAVVLACGSFEANREWRARYLGKSWDLVKVRGSRYNTGEGLRMALDVGAQPAGHWSGCHATPIDINAAEVGSREHTDTTNRLSFPYSIMVNVEGKRFADEGEDVYALTYAKYGSVILGQPRRTAYQVFDAKVEHLLEHRYSTGKRVTAGSVEELADKLGLDRKAFVKTVEEFNAAVQEGKFTPHVKDGKSTQGITPKKSNWAVKIDTPPVFAYAVTGGITFAFGGVKVNRYGQVLNTEDGVIPGLYATGEMVGGLFYHNYPGGTELTAGAVFGRLGGAHAASQ